MERTQANWEWAIGSGVASKVEQILVLSFKGNEKTRTGKGDSNFQGT